MSVFYKINNAVDLDLNCEFIDLNNNRMWTTLIRKIEDINEGVVRMLIIIGTRNWRYFKGAYCKYPMTLSKPIWVTSAFCKVNEDNLIKFKYNRYHL